MEDSFAWKSGKYAFMNLVQTLYSEMREVADGDFLALDFPPEKLPIIVRYEWERLWLFTYTHDCFCSRERIVKTSTTTKTRQKESEIGQDTTGDIPDRTR